MQEEINQEVSSLSPVDEEDLTRSYNDNGRSVTKFADRPYSPQNFSGKGYKILRKNIKPVSLALTKIIVSSVPTSDGYLAFIINGVESHVDVVASTDTTTDKVAEKIAAKLSETMTEYEVSKDASTITLTRKFGGIVSTPSSFSAVGTGVSCSVKDSSKTELRNLLTAVMINQPNTIYEIRYDYNLDGATINLPQKCILKFCGGSLNNGKLTGDSSIIEASPVKIFGKDLDILGTFVNSMNYAEWYDLDYEKTLLSFYGIDFIGNYLISKKISVDTGTHRIYLKFHPQSKITVDTTFTNDYLFDIKVSSEKDKTIVKRINLVSGQGEIDLSERCGFISFTASDKVVDAEAKGTDFCNLINIHHAGKSIDDTVPTYDSNTIVNTAIIKVSTGCSFENINISATRNVLASVPDCGILLQGADHKLNRVTIITRTIGIYNITGNTFIQDCHVWGAPNIAFYITGPHTINNTYGDWALCSFYLKNTTFINVTNHFVIGSLTPSQTDWYQGNNMCMIKHKTPTKVNGIFSYFQVRASNIKILTDDTNNEDFLEKSNLYCSYIGNDKNRAIFNRKHKKITDASLEDYRYFKINIIPYRHLSKIIFHKDSGIEEIYYYLRTNSTSNIRYLYEDLRNIPDKTREFYYNPSDNSTIYTKAKGNYYDIVIETYFNNVDIPSIEEISKDEYEIQY